MSTFLKNVLSELEIAEQERELAAKRDWVDLFVAVAQERCNLKPKQIVDKLSAIGKTLEDLQEAVEKYLTRCQLAAEAAELEKQLLPRKELTAEMNEAGRVRSETIAAQDRIISQIQLKITQNDNRDSRIREIRRRLTESAQPEFISIDRGYEQQLQLLKDREDRLNWQIRVNTNREHGANSQSIRELESELAATQSERIEVQSNRDRNSELMFAPDSFA